MNYYIQNEDRPLEPLTADEIKLRIRQHKLSESDLIQRQSEETWRTLDSLEEFRAAVAAARPEKMTYDARPKGNPLAILSLLLVLFSFLLASITDPFNRDLNTILRWLSIITIILGLVAGHAAVKRSRALQKGFGSRLTARAALTIGYSFIVLIGLVGTGGHPIQEKGSIAKAISNCRQIITALRFYASDHEGKYPDSKLPNTHISNEVFRELFKDGQADSEQIFGSPSSGDGRPDGNIGEKPDYAEALKPGENHWAMTRGLTDSDPGNIPLVFESPSDPTWPPKWNPEYAGTTKPGRTWSGGKVIIGFNDGSVSAMKLESAKGRDVGFAPRPDGTQVFPIIPGRKFEVLDVLQ